MEPSPCFEPASDPNLTSGAERGGASLIGSFWIVALACSTHCRPHALIGELIHITVSMATPFSRTCRSLTNDSAGSALLVWGLVLALLAAWMGWLLFAKVTVYEVSQSAQLQVEQAAHPVAAQLAGKVLSSSLQLGKQVAAGDVLVELDARTERLRLAEEAARLAAIPPQLQALQQQLADQEQAVARARTASAGTSASRRCP